MKKIKKDFEKEYVGVTINADDFKNILSLLIENDFKYTIEHENIVIDKEEEFLELFDGDTLTNIELYARVSNYDSIYLRIKYDFTRLTSQNIENEKIYLIIHKINDILENKQNKLYLLFKEPYNFIIYLIIITFIIIMFTMIVKNEKILVLLIIPIAFVGTLISYLIDKSIIRNKVVKYEYKSYTKKSIDFLKSNMSGIVVGVLATVIGGLILNFIIN